MKTLREGLPLVASNEGEWRGTYSFISPTGWINDRYDFRIVLSIFDDPALSYRQESYYTWSDGTQIFRMMFLTPARNTGAYAEGIRRTMFSFGRLSEREASDLKPMRLITVPASPDDTA